MTAGDDATGGPRGAGGGGEGAGEVKTVWLAVVFVVGEADVAITAVLEIDTVLSGAGDDGGGMTFPSEPPKA